MRLNRIVSILLAAVLLVSSLTSCSRTPEELIARAEDTLTKKAYVVEVDIDYHVTDSTVAGIFEQLERSETTLYFKDGLFKSVNEQTIDDGEDVYHFFYEYVLADGVLYCVTTYSVDGYDNDTQKGKSQIDDGEAASFIGAQMIIGDVSEDDFKGATLVKKGSDVYLSCQNVSDEMYIALEKALVSQMEGVSKSVKATSAKMSVELDGKRYDTITVECTFDVVISDKTYSVGMTVELEFEYDERFEIEAPKDPSTYNLVELEELI